jgi:hypothetical protein
MNWRNINHGSTKEAHIWRMPSYGEKPRFLHKPHSVIPEDDIIHSHCREDPKSYVVLKIVGSQETRQIAAM